MFFHMSFKCAHEVLKCELLWSVDVRPPSYVIIFFVNILDAIQPSWNLLRMFILKMSRIFLFVGFLQLKTKSPALEKNSLEATSFIQLP